MPTAVPDFNKDLITTLPDPTIKFDDSFKLLLITEPVPIKLLLPILTWPAILTPGQIVLKFPIFGLMIYC